MALFTSHGSASEGLAALSLVGSGSSTLGGTGKQLSRLITDWLRRLVTDLTLLEVTEELIVILLHIDGLGVGLVVEDLLHHLLELLLPLLYGRILTFDLGFELLVLQQDLVDLLLETDLLLVKTLLVSVLHAVRDVSSLNQVLLGLVIREVGDTLELHGRLQLIPESRLRPGSAPLGNAKAL